MLAYVCTVYIQVYSLLFIVAVSHLVVLAACHFPEV